MVESDTYSILPSDRLNADALALVLIAVVDVHLLARFVDSLEIERCFAVISSN